MKEKNENENPDVRNTYYADDPDNPQQLPLIIKEINKLVGTTKRNIFLIGKLLTEAKALVAHGEFQQWIEDNFDFKYQTANNFINIYKSCLERPSLVESIEASVLYKIAAPGFPKDLRDYLFKHGDTLSNISNSQIKDIMERYKKKEIDIESPEIKGLIQYREENSKFKSYTEEVDDCIDQLRQLEKMVVKVSTAIIWPIVPGMDKPGMTEEQMEMLKDIRKDTGKALDKVFPPADSVKIIIKPSVAKIIKGQKLAGPEKE